MTWNSGRARQRIRKSMADVPNIDVSRYVEDYLPDYRKHAQALMDAKKNPSPPLFRIPRNRAVLVETVQIYIQITNYDEYRLSDGKETQESHQNALRFLHLYYTACDRITEKTAPQRIDFHGGRMHAAILFQGGEKQPSDVIIEALDFIRTFQAVAIEANQALANDEFSAEFRFGVDFGQCVAINNGTGLEQEPLFLGSAANYAAKLAKGSTPGIFLSERARRLVGLPMVSDPAASGIDPNRVDRLIISLLGKRFGTPVAKTIMDTWQADVRSNAGVNLKPDDFQFRFKPSPLSDIDFADLSPGNSIRMDLVSLFADIDKYTAYVDKCIDEKTVADAVRALYVIRDELKSVVQEDFDGRKVRFIGDCIHALLAETESNKTAAQASVHMAAKCAGALHDSFELCKQELNGISELGLAVGFEYGPTPISRVGIRGERSVRVASSVATTASEKLQCLCTPGETYFGESAQQVMSTSLRALLTRDGAVSNLAFEDVATALSEGAAKIPANVYATPRKTTQHRAHFKT